MATSGSILGHAVRRVEDPGILRGATRYTDDLPAGAAAHLAFVRATVAHGRIEAVDVGAARAVPGVLAAFTAADLGLADQHQMGLAPAAFSRPPLARDRVRFAGELVAAVVAESRAAAVDAAEQVVVDYDPLPAVVDAEEALAPGASLLFPDHGSNLALEFQHGDDPHLFDGADVVVSATFRNQRLAGVPMEPNAILAVPGEPAGGLTVWVPTQAPHGMRKPLARAVGVDAELLRVVAPAVGGGFGPKTGCYMEYIVAAAAALRLDRPVRWVETRSENLLSMVHGRGQVQHVSIGVTRAGDVVALRADLVADSGAYPSTGAFLPSLTRTMASAVYRIPRIQVNSRSAVTNTTTTAAYRGAGRPEAAAMVERVLDMAAAELGIDPAEIRRRNFIPPDAFPYTTATGTKYDTGEYERSLDAALAAAGYDALRAEQAERRARGDARLLGVGVACYVEITAPGLTAEYGAVEVGEDGTVTATVGTSAHGQGHETAFAMILSDLLGVPMDAVRVVQSDTALVPRGWGTMGSRSLQIGGTALLRAGEVVLDRARRIAAHLLEANPDDIVAGQGGLHVAGVPSRAVPWSDLARVANDDTRRPPDVEAGLAHAVDHDQGESAFPFGAHVAVVEVDSETGRVDLVRHVAVDDCGRILNPLLVAGQQHGGIAQGAAQALFEEVRYDADGNPVTATLMDYAMPSAAELPSFEVSNTETPTPLNPLGAKGIGESATIGSTPAVQNAVVDALAHLGVRHLDMPATPERVWRAIDDARAGRAAR